MNLLILFGYGSHVILEVGFENQVLELHMFILPTHGSHALPPLDVKHCFKSFKNTSKKIKMFGGWHPREVSHIYLGST